MRWDNGVYYRKREDLLKFIDGKILDVGCDQSEFHNNVQEKFGSRNVIGIDIMVTRYKENFVRGTAETLPFKDNTFDGVFAGLVIEHLKDPCEFLSELKRVLKKDGVIVVTALNMKRVGYLIHILLGYRMAKLLFRVSEPLNPHDHLYAWDLDLFENLIKANGFEVIEIGHSGLFRRRFLDIFLWFNKGFSQDVFAVIK